MTKEAHQNRETWLNVMKQEMRPMFEAAGAPIPANVRVSVGFPSTGKRGRRIGECWSDKASADGTFEILIRPDQADAMDVAQILAHELIHAAVGLECGHKGPFKRVAVAIGLQGKMTATVAGPKFVEAVQPFIEKHGDIPHAKLGAQAERSGPKKQTARMIKCVCNCGYTVRMARKWIEEVGAPHCPAHGEMKVITPDE